MKTIFLLVKVAIAMNTATIFYLVCAILFIVMVFYIIKNVEDMVHNNLKEPTDSREGYVTEEKIHFALNNPSNLPEGCVKCNDLVVLEFLHKMYLAESEIDDTVHIFKEFLPKFNMDIIHFPDKENAWDYCYLIKTKKGKVIIFRSLERKRTVPPLVYIQGKVHTKLVRNLVYLFCHRVLNSIGISHKKVHHRL